MSKEADRLIAEFLGETDHLKKWCSDAGAGEPLQLCIEDPGETQRPDSCRHLAKGGCWNDCKSKAMTDPPAYSTCDSDALEAIKALMNSGSKMREFAAGVLEDFSDYSNPTDGLLAKELVDAMVEEYDLTFPSDCVTERKRLRIKPALEQTLKEKSDGRV